MTEMEIKKGKYRHFKGNIYELICIAKNSETLEDMVIYRSVKNENDVWVRPLSMWCEEVEYQGKTVSRFTYIQD
ncbi:MAG: DUF1653 domain-containing protein [Clostridia bacterium]|nr:DUF1653 domain-containing protein [Clostridia bacterium]